jgi:nicotinamidase-related amidase
MLFTRCYSHDAERAICPETLQPGAAEKTGAICLFEAKGKTMPLTKLDSTAALIVIDLQKGILRMPTVDPAAEIVGRAARLARAFRERGLPVVLVNVSGRAPGRTDAEAPKLSFPPDWTELVAELEPQPTDYFVTKQRMGAFIGTSLNNYLRQRGVTQVFLSGISTSAGVESTARSAYDHGYNVVFVVDAMTDRDGDMHRRSVEKIFPRLGETESTETVLKLVNAAPSSGT